MCDNVSLVCAVCRMGIYSVCRRLCCKKPPPEKPEFSILCVGLSKSGKSSVLCVLSGEDVDAIEPTVGFSIKAVIMDNCILNVKELGGGDSVRPYWDRYFQGSQAVIYMISSCCSEEDLDVNKTEISKVASHRSLRTLPLLVLITQEEKEGARSVDQISQRLDLPSLSYKRSLIVRSCKTNDREGLRGAVENLCHELLKPEDTVAARAKGKESNQI
ncbi:ADP-ribosylation factor-like protein 15 isoform X2 [Liolophura sinensis]|uniref:ADP-ribosylation factor-like protein 15 isoform X2 n=1 Tax=Liolophura sinensis TaxID=3198878 RepID=UPI003158A218